MRWPLIRLKRPSFLAEMFFVVEDQVLVIHMCGVAEDQWLRVLVCMSLWPEGRNPVRPRFGSFVPVRPSRLVMTWFGGPGSSETCFGPGPNRVYVGQSLLGLFRLLYF